MDIRNALRGAAVLSLAAAIVGTTTLTPAAYAAPTDGSVDFHSVANKPKTEKSGNKSNDGIGDVPIIGDVVNTFKDSEPEDIVVGAFQFAAVAAETGAPLIRSLFDK